MGSNIPLGHNQPENTLLAKTCLPEKKIMILHLRPQACGKFSPATVNFVKSLSPSFTGLPSPPVQSVSSDLMKLLHSEQSITHRGGWSWTESIGFKYDLPVAVQPNETARQPASWATINCEMNDNRTSKGVVFFNLVRQLLGKLQELLELRDIFSQYCCLSHSILTLRVTGAREQAT